jgi:hypothetical protein
MGHILRITGNDVLKTYFQIPFETSFTKQIRVYVRLPVTPSIPFFYSYDASLMGEISLEEFLLRVQKIPTPTSIGGYARFGLNGNDVHVSLARANLSATTTDVQYHSGTHLYPTIFFLQPLPGWPPTLKSNIGVGSSQNVVVLENVDLNRYGAAFSYSWRN